jgi:putative hydrolase of the HAD superfamily
LVLHNLSNIKAIVFDLDDTLYPQIDFKRSGFRAVADWLTSRIDMDRKVIVDKLEGILDDYGPSYPWMFNRLIERTSIPKAYLPDMIEVFIGHSPAIDCFDGVVPMITRLGKKYRLGILTDGRRTVQQGKIAALGLASMVDAVLCSDALGLEKPASELFAWFERQFSMAGNKLLYVGDNPFKDFIGARQREWATVGVRTGEHAAVDVNESYRPDRWIDAVTELEGLLN